jgi:hypothetical protein
MVQVKAYLVACKRFYAGFRKHFQHRGIIKCVASSNQGHAFISSIGNIVITSLVNYTNHADPLARGFGYAYEKIGIKGVNSAILATPLTGQCN